MKKLLLIIASLVAITNLYAQTPAPITGSSSICQGATTTLSDITIGGAWTSSNPAVASIGSATGLLSGVSAGVVTITYTISTGYVTMVLGVHANPSSFVVPSSICIGGSIPITLTDATSGGVWSSANPFVVSIGSSTGLITGVSTGTVNLSYTLSTGCYTTASITANSIAISGASVLCAGGSPIGLTDATGGGTWTSSNPGIASVGIGSGIVSPVSLGTTTISYTLSPGCVSLATISVKGLPTISPSSVAGCVNSTYQLTATPPGGGWASANPAIASVNFLGVVSGVALGVTSITYTAAGGCSTSIPVTINPLPAAVTGTNYVYSGLTTSLGDPTPGGTWTSGNLALATVNPSSGVVTGVASGMVLISYSLSTGCFSYYRIQVNPLPATTNIYAWYPFCGDSSDHSGYGRDLINHGIATTPATLTTDRFGSPNSAYHFNGVNSMMNYTTFFPNSGTPPDFTYSCWVQVGVAQSGIIMYNGNPGADGFGFVINNGTLGVPGTNVGVLFGGSGVLYASTPITTGVWHNLVIVKDGGVYNFYVDDAPGIFFIETATPLYSDVFALGLNYHSTLPGMGPITDAFNGDIDDVAVISRQLSSAERLSLYNFNPDATPFSLGNDTTICSDEFVLAPNPQTVGAIYTWSLFNGLSYVTIDTTHTVLTVYPAIGAFGNSYALNISKPYGCTVADTVVVYKAPIPVNLGPDQNVCIGDTVTLTNSFPSASFLWSTGDTTHALKVTTTGTYYVTVDSIYLYGPGDIDTAVCVGRDTVNVSFHPVPFVSLPTTPTNCVGGTVMLYSYPDTAYLYHWSTGATTDTITATSTNTYWVQVNDKGCIRYDTTSVTIVYDTVTFYDFKDTAICLNAPAGVTRLSTFNPIVGYQWTPTSGIIVSNTNVGVIKPDTSAEYYLTVTYPGCPNIVDSFYIDVQPNPTVYMGGNRDVCYGDTLHIQASVSPAWYTHYIFSWTPPIDLDNTNTSIVVFNSELATQDTAIKYYITVTTPAWTVGLAQGCISEDSGVVFVHPRRFDTLHSFVNLCPGDSVQLIPVDTSTLGAVVASYRWSPGLYLNDSMSSMPWVHPITSQFYRLIAYSQYGCRDTMGVDIEVYPAAVINLGDSVTIYPGNTYQISPQTNCTYFQWFPPLGLDNVNVSNPTAGPSVNTTYFVQATTESGCTTYDSIRIHVDPTSTIAMPNAFSPGASVNSRFSVIVQGLASLNYFHIFDRWGDMVYDSRNIADGWDGTWKGQPQPFGVYVYELEAVTASGQVIKRRGNVTLIR